MRKKALTNAILWVLTAVFLILSIIYFVRWREHPYPDKPDYVNKWYWIIFAVIALVCIAIWFFTREKEEEVSITRGS